MVLSTQSGIVLTERCAVKYFGRSDPIGRRRTVAAGSVKRDFHVSGIASEPPKNSVFDRDIVSARAEGWSRPEVPFSFGLS